MGGRPPKVCSGASSAMPPRGGKAPSTAAAACPTKLQCFSVERRDSMAEKTCRRWARLFWQHCGGSSWVD